MNKVKKGVLLLMFLGAGAAQAQTIGAGAISGSESKATSNANSGAASNSNQSQGQNQTSASGAAAFQGQDASNTNVIKFGDTPANTTASITTDTNIHGTQRIVSAPAIGMGILSPTTPCSNTYQIGVSGMGFGVGAGGVAIDSDCTRREYARILWAAGATHAAIGMLCQNEELAKVAPVMCKKSRDELTAGQLPTQPLPAYPSTQPVPVPPPPVAAPKTSSTVQQIVQPQASVAPVPPSNTSSGGPQVGDVMKGNDGVTYRFTGSAWVKVVNSMQPLVPNNVEARVNLSYLGRDVGPTAARSNLE